MKILPLQELNDVYSNCTFPFPHVFGLRRLRTAIRLVRFGYNTFTGCVAERVAPIPPFPLKREPTASALRGDTLSTRIDCYRSLFMSLVRGRKKSKLVRSLVLYVKLGVRFLAALRLAL